MPSPSRSAAAILLVSLLGCSESAPEAVMYVGVAEPAPAAPSVATLVRVTGDVRVAPAGTGQWVRGVENRPLRAADAVQAMEGASATVRFGDGEVTTELSPGTTLRIPAQAPRVARLRHLSGQLTARLSSRPDTTRLEVALPSGQLILDHAGSDAEGVAEARVTIEDDVSEIAMLRGRGRLERDDGGRVTVEEAHYARVHIEDGVVGEGLDMAFPAGVVEPAPDTEHVTQGVLDFRWEPVERATGYRLRIQDADGVTRTVDRQDPRARLRLGTGSFTWSVSALFGQEEGHPRPPAAFAHRVDRTAPTLTLDSPRPNETTRGRVVMVAGRTEPRSSVRVNGTTVPVGESGGFRAATPVSVGLTNLVVETRDALGNRRALTRSVLRSR